MKITLVLFALLVVKSYQQCLTPNDGQLSNKLTRQGLYTGQQDFSLALLNAIHKLMPNENLFFSPYSTYHALLISYFIAGNQTENYLKKVLRLDDVLTKHDIYNAYKLDRLTTIRRAANASYSFTSANKVYVGDQISIRECMKNYLDYELERAAFQADPEAARLAINAWVEERTHNMIQDLLPGGSINADTNLVLVNAAYFKGVWVNKFNTNETKQEVFYVNPSKQIIVDMMHIEGTFNHDVSETLGAHILELPYEGDKISMYVFLPPFAKDDAIENTLKKLTVEEFKRIVDNNSLVEKTVQVAMPRFSLEQTIELVPVLDSMGVGDLFLPSADFSTLTNGSKVQLGRALHKAKIEVNEQGTKAAAATVLFTFRSSRPLEPARFVCDHPFIYVIYNKEEQAVLFSGVFRRPH